MKASNTVKFNPDGRLVVMQVSDPQDLVFVRRAMVKMLDKAYDTVKPDLVLFTGDNILGNHLLDARFGSRKVASGWRAEYDRMKTSLRHILAPLEKRGIPFAMIYGNHDDRNSVTKEEQAGIFRRYSMCLPMNNNDSSRDCDTYNIPVLSSDGEKTLLNFWMLDTAWYDKGEDKCYEAIKKEAVDWFKAENGRLKEANGGRPVPSLMFMHIPFPQQKKLCTFCPASDSGALRLRNGASIKLNPELANGVRGEPPSVCDDDYGMFEAVKDNSGVMAVVSGHDHRNSFEGVYDSVRFIQTGAASFRCYGSRMRGVRVFTFDEKNPEAFTTEVLTYDDIIGTSPKARFEYFWDADEQQKAKYIALGSAALTAAAAGTWAAIKKHR